MASACRAAGIAGIVFHDLRRSAVRNMDRAGVSPAVAMRLSRHKMASVYRRYWIVAEDDLRERSPGSRPLWRRDRPER